MSEFLSTLPGGLVTGSVPRIAGNLTLILWAQWKNYSGPQPSDYEVLYASVPESVFPQPIVTIPRWRARVLAAVPSLRNDVTVVAVKR